MVLAEWQRRNKEERRNGSVISRRRPATAVSIPGILGRERAGEKQGTLLDDEMALADLGSHLVVLASPCICLSDPWEHAVAPPWFLWFMISVSHRSDWVLTISSLEFSRVWCVVRCAFQRFSLKYSYMIFSQLYYPIKPLAICDLNNRFGEMIRF